MGSKQKTWQAITTWTARTYPWSCQGTVRALIGSYPRTCFSRFASNCSRESNGPGFLASPAPGGPAPSVAPPRWVSDHTAFRAWSPYQKLSLCKPMNSRHILLLQRGMTAHRRANLTGPPGLY